jgi:hypothetical protein
LIPLSGRGRLSVVPRAKYFGAARQLVLARPKSAAESLGGKSRDVGRFYPTVFLLATFR